MADGGGMAGRSSKGMVRRLAVLLGSVALLLPLAEPLRPRTGAVARTLLAMAAATMATPALANNEIPDQVATVGMPFSFTFPANTFQESGVADGNPPYTTNELPGWLSFNAATRTFSGTPQAGDEGAHRVLVIANDGQDNGHSRTDTVSFHIKVGTACPAPDFSAAGRRQIWTGTLTVGFIDTYNTGGDSNNGLYFGFDSDTTTDIRGVQKSGSLDDTTFTINSQDYTITKVEVLETGVNEEGVANEGDGELAFDLGLHPSPALDGRAKEELQLHVCDTAYDFNDATNVRHLAGLGLPPTYFFRWSDADLDWSGETERTLYLSLPANRTPIAPTISSTGGAQVGDSLTVDPSTIMDADGLPDLLDPDNVCREHCQFPAPETPANFTYQWIREDEDGSNPVEITDATSTTYRLTDDDLGKRVKVQVTFTDLLGTEETVESIWPSSGVVTQFACIEPNLGTRRPIWSGTLTPAQRGLSNEYGYDAEGGTGSLSPAEFSIRPTDFTISRIESRVTRSQVPSRLRLFMNPYLTPPQVDALRLHVCDMEFELSDGRSPGSSIYEWGPSNLNWSDGVARSLVLSAPADTPVTGLPTITHTGTGVPMDVLTADTTAIMDADGLSRSCQRYVFDLESGGHICDEVSDPFRYQWIRADADGSNPQDITGETMETYTMTAADVGRRLQVRVQFFDILGTEGELLSAAWMDGTTVVSLTTSGVQGDVPDNAAPPLASQQAMAEQMVVVMGRQFTFSVPENTFTGMGMDGDTLIYTASQMDGSNLPDWLSFDTEMGTFSGMPETADVQTLTTTVTATDGTGESVSITFDIVVVAPAMPSEATSEDVPSGGSTPAEAMTNMGGAITAGIVTPALVNLNEGQMDTYTLVLDTAPTGPVTITPTSSDSDAVSVSPASVVFTTANWDTPQAVTVTGVEDDDAIPETVDINHNSVSGDIVTTHPDNDVIVRVMDNDTPGVSVLPTSLNPVKGQTRTYTLVLDTLPGGPVTITPTSSDSDAVSVSPASVVFTIANWDTPQAVTVTTVEDGDTTDETVTISHSVSGYGSYGSVTADDVMVTVDEAAQEAKAVLEEVALPDVLQQVTARTTEVIASRLNTIASGSLPTAPLTLSLDDVVADTVAFLYGERSHLKDSSLEWQQALAGRSFAFPLSSIFSGLTLAQGEGASPQEGLFSTLAIWGGADYSSYGNTVMGTDMDGSGFSGTIGMDLQPMPRLVTGLALTTGRWGLNYDTETNGASADGTYDVGITVVNPYLNWWATDQLGLWGSFGYGRGQVEHTPDGDNSAPTDPETDSFTNWAGGLRFEALPGADPLTGEGAPFGLAFKVDGAASKFLDTDVQLARLAAEVSRSFPVETGLLNAALELGWAIRNVSDKDDLNDLQKRIADENHGGGAELAGRLHWLNGNGSLSATVDTRVLLSGDDRREWGIGGQLRITPSKRDGEGLSLSLQPSFGVTGTRLAELWSLSGDGDLAINNHQPGARLDAQLAYGFPLGNVLLTPYTEMAWAEAISTWGAGLRYGLNTSLELDLKGVHHSRTNGNTENRLLLELRSQL